MKQVEESATWFRENMFDQQQLHQFTGTCYVNVDKGNQELNGKKYGLVFFFFHSFD